MSLMIGFSFYSKNSVAELPLIQTPLSTQGAEIVDAKGHPVLLRGINWFGIETDTHAPHGLWARDYKDMLAQMKDLGFNMIRLPYSVQSLQESTVKGIDFSIGSNRDLEGKTSLEVMDRIIEEAGQYGLMVLLDSHRLNDKEIPELWYGDGFTEADWVNTWTMLAKRYRHQANVIGADLKNEPHGRASWGTGDKATDWRMAAELAGEAILDINPDWLIVVEGVEKNVPAQVLDTHWWGGNLEGVRNYPIRLSRLDKLVYSPHEYGSGVFPQAWFSDRTFPNNLYRRWEIGFQYIARLKLAPILVGEFGGHKIGYWSKEGIWQRQFLDYLGENNLNFAYWSWNPNSDNTGGILEDDWRSVDGRKQHYLGKLLGKISFVGAITAQIDPSAVPQAAQAVPQTARASRYPQGVAPSPSPAIAAAPASPVKNQDAKPPEIAQTAAIDSLQYTTHLDSDWQTGFCFRMQVTNQGAARSPNWRLRFQMADAVIDNSWGGRFDRQGIAYTVEPLDWGRSLYPDQTVDLGFCATKKGSDYQPRQVSLHLDE
ncbi:MAG: cellulase family glycosylhydrolase [Cyanobacteria bacterium CAN_BIN43]|nr:cellulase family glycosylhydrolase [Cyanobacteria bacterium CAN_BIN43]